MSIVPAKCTECGGMLQADQEKEAAVCPHCNTPFIIEKAINNYIEISGQNDFEIRAGVLLKYNGAEDDVIVPDNVTIISNEAFIGCVGLRSIEIPESVDVIEEFAFAGCSRLINVILPDSITTIEHGLFFDCSSLTSITIPDSVTSIGETAFGECRSLTSITIPVNITSIAASAFNGCHNLTVINGRPESEYSAVKILKKAENQENPKESNARHFKKLFKIVAAIMVPASPFFIYAIMTHNFKYLRYGVIVCFLGWICASVIIAINNRKRNG